MKQSDNLSFRYELERQKPRTGSGGTTRGASVHEFPASIGVAGVSMRLDPGSMRELHWHANAAEWGYVVSGRCRTTLLNPDGPTETDEFGPGDVWYFPRGWGHSIQGLGPGECHFILIFDNGDFSRGSYFQHHRLAGPYAGCGRAAELGSWRGSRRQASKWRGLFRQGTCTGQPLARCLRAQILPSLSAPIATPCWRNNRAAWRAGVSSISLR